MMKWAYQPTVDDPLEQKEPHMEGYGLRPLTLRRTENLFRNGHYAEAIPQFLKALNEGHFGPGWFVAIAENHLGLCYEQSGDVQEALTHYENGIKIYADDGGANQKTRLLLKLRHYSLETRQTLG
jgi:tetratricopeptide (TPR) repeat protein